MCKFVCFVVLVMTANCFAAEDRSTSKTGMVVYPLCKQAADKLIAGLPEDLKTVISPDVLSESLQRVIPKRVENHTLIEDILFQSNPFEEKGTGLLLLLVAYNEALRVQEMHKKE